MRVDLLYLTRNRLPYARHSLPTLLADREEEFSLTIWDNGSSDGTREFLESIDDRRIVRKVYSPENIPPCQVWNRCVAESGADLFGFVADDLLVTPGWVRALSKAHEDVPEFGRIACWHLIPEAFDYERAHWKIQHFGNHSILRHPWTNGCGLAKIKALRETGVVVDSEGESRYWIRVALKGYVNGFYYPLIYADHMDDPWSKYFPFKDRFDEWLQQSATAKRMELRSLEEAEAWHEEIVRGILCDPWQAESYVGWRGKVRRAKRKARRLLMGTRF